MKSPILIFFGLLLIAPSCKWSSYTSNDAVPVAVAIGTEEPYESPLSGSTGRSAFSSSELTMYRDFLWNKKVDSIIIKVGQLYAITGIYKFKNCAIYRLYLTENYSNPYIHNTEIEALEYERAMSILNDINSLFISKHLKPVVSKTPSDCVEIISPHWIELSIFYKGNKIPYKEIVQCLEYPGDGYQYTFSETFRHLVNELTYDIGFPEE